MINDKYSFKDFTHQNFSHLPAEEFNDTEIIGSCFYQENKPREKIFPDGIKGVVFKKCNFDNVSIPPGSRVEGCCRRLIKVQNDWDDWVLDGYLKPVEPLNKGERLKNKISIDPKDIPNEKFTKEQRRGFEEMFIPKGVEET